MRGLTVYHGASGWGWGGGGGEEGPDEMGRKDPMECGGRTRWNGKEGPDGMWALTVYQHVVCDVLCVPPPPPPPTHTHIHTRHNLNRSPFL